MPARWCLRFQHINTSISATFSEAPTCNTQRFTRTFKVAQVPAVGVVVIVVRVLVVRNSDPRMFTMLALPHILWPAQRSLNSRNLPGQWDKDGKPYATIPTIPSKIHGYVQAAFGVFFRIAFCFLAFLSFCMAAITFVVYILHLHYQFYQY